MNIIKKAYCRIFQFCFKIAIPLLPYRNPAILDTVSEIPSVLRDKKIAGVLIVTDKSVSGLEIFGKLVSVLEAAEIRYTIFDGTIPNPTVHNIEDARQLYLDQRCQAIIAIGGGSSIDCAKIVGARIAKPRQSVSKMKGILKILKKTPFFIAIPTTAGTGSEVTLASVITDSDKNHKFPINDFSLIPDAAVLDPEATRTLPKHLTATTGMDALTHAVEAYIGRSTVKSTRKDALSAVKLICENLEKAYNNTDNTEARRNMLHASFMAGRAFSKSYVGYCHAVAHSLGGEYHTPHGLANAVLLPYVLETYGRTAHKKLKALAIAAGIANSSTPEAYAAKQFIQMLRDMNRRMNIPQKFDFIQKEDISKLAAFADKEANPLYPVPRLMNAKELEKFYFDVME